MTTKVGKLDSEVPKKSRVAWLSWLFAFLCMVPQPRAILHWVEWSVERATQNHISNMVSDEKGVYCIDHLNQLNKQTD